MWRFLKYLLLFLFSTSMLFVSVYAFFDIKDYASRAEQTTAVIADTRSEVRESTGRRGRRTTSTHYYRTIEFTTSAGREVRTETSGSSSDQIGQTVPILYDPANPTDVRDTGGFGLWGLVFITGGFGLAGLGAALVSLALDRRKRAAFKQNTAPVPGDYSNLM